MYLNILKNFCIGNTGHSRPRSRLDVFRLLVKAGAESVPAGKVASRLGAVQNTMSAHLKILYHAGLVRPKKEGRMVRLPQRGQERQATALTAHKWAQFEAFLALSKAQLEEKLYAFAAEIENNTIEV